MNRLPGLPRLNPETTNSLTCSRITSPSRRARRAEVIEILHVELVRAAAEVKTDPVPGSASPRRRRGRRENDTKWLTRRGADCRERSSAPYQPGNYQGSPNSTFSAGLAIRRRMTGPSDIRRTNERRLSAMS